jgi:hypothetical protein
MVFLSFGLVVRLTTAIRVAVFRLACEVVCYSLILLAWILSPIVWFVTPWWERN